MPALLAALVAWQIRGLWRKYRARAFGSRLTVRLLLLLALMAVVPGALVYTVSVQFLSKSIESWFDVKVDAALEGGINLGQSALDQMLGELQARGARHRGGARRPAPQPAGRACWAGCATRPASRKRSSSAPAGACWPVPARTCRGWCPELPSQQALRQARSARAYTAIDAAAGKPLALRVIVPVASLA